MITVFNYTMYIMPRTDKKASEGSFIFFSARALARLTDLFGRLVSFTLHLLVVASSIIPFLLMVIPLMFRYSSN